MLKKALPGVLLVFTIALIAASAAPVATAACRGEDENPDAWEARHNAYQPPERVMDAIGVKPGMVIAEVGAGRGRYVVHISRRVGETGKVYANDIDGDKLEYVEFRCRRDSIFNVATILGEVTDPHLPEGELDVVYMINTYHHLDKPVELMKNIIPALNPGGVLVIIEHDPVKCPDAGSHSTPQEVLFENASRAGFNLIRIETFLARDNINIFRPKEMLKKQYQIDEDARHRH